MDYELLTGVQTIRINQNLPRIIDANQRGLMNDHYIGSNILELQNLIDYVNENNMAGLLMCIDFEKGFDTIEWEFLFKTQEYFKFGEILISCIKIYYNVCTFE